MTGSPASLIAFTRLTLKSGLPPQMNSASGLVHDMGDARALEQLVGVIRHDPDGAVREIACDVLGKIADERALDALLWVQNNDEGVGEDEMPVSMAAHYAIEEIHARMSGS